MRREGCLRDGTPPGLIRSEACSGVWCAERSLREDLDMFDAGSELCCFVLLFTSCKCEVGVWGRRESGAFIGWDWTGRIVKNREMNQDDEVFACPQER